MPQPLRLSPPAANLRPPDDLARRDGFRRIAGVDEAGCGPWAGPVVAAAVILQDKTLPVEIDDSKRLTHRQRERAYRVILESGDVGIGIVSAEEIDRQNIMRATLLAMQQAVDDLPRRPDLVLVDGNRAPTLEVPCRTIPHGDRLSYVIACASIIAKVLRDDVMAFYDRLYPAYAFRISKGYGTKHHAQALMRYGPSFLHRLSFRPVKARVSAPP